MGLASTLHFFAKKQMATEDFFPALNLFHAGSSSFVLPPPSPPSPLSRMSNPESYCFKNKNYTLAIISRCTVKAVTDRYPLCDVPICSIWTQFRLISSLRAVSSSGALSLVRAGCPCGTIVPLSTGPCRLWPGCRSHSILQQCSSHTAQLQTVLSCCWMSLVGTFLVLQCR